jgi:hypothetical protein
MTCVLTFDYNIACELWKVGSMCSMRKLEIDKDPISGIYTVAERLT